MSVLRVPVGCQLQNLLRVVAVDTNQNMCKTSVAQLLVLVSMTQEMYVDQMIL
jgi:hypothetical protein